VEGRIRTKGEGGAGQESKGKELASRIETLYVTREQGSNRDLQCSREGRGKGEKEAKGWKLQTTRSGSGKSSKQLNNSVASTDRTGHN